MSPHVRTGIWKLLSVLSDRFVFFLTEIANKMKCNRKRHLNGTDCPLDIVVGISPKIKVAH